MKKCVLYALGGLLPVVLFIVITGMNSKDKEGETKMAPEKGEKSPTLHSFGDGAVRVGGISKQY